jgi:hypothetical protein
MSNMMAAFNMESDFSYMNFLHVTILNLCSLSINAKSTKLSVILPMTQHLFHEAHEESTFKQVRKCTHSIVIQTLNLGI